MVGVIKKRKKNWLGHCMRNECLMKTRRHDKREKRTRKEETYNIKGKYSETKRLAENREAWRLP
ncbi:hypothetical protein J437_LFUL001656 [Ladona fulva]|uniref:Uncharacterized protein n=1 Tax=Ladona fulva TaxID=123851 RepID=A0A8K0K3P9_LADFU|nr:hypothetical protein J437_LFUL001656 [Ladona fulva]